MRLLRERAIERLRADAASLTEGGSKVCTLMIAFFLEGKWGGWGLLLPKLAHE